MSDFGLLLAVIVLGLFGIKMFLSGLKGQDLISKKGGSVAGTRKVSAMIFGAILTIISILLILVFIFG